jgi:hypothetical protein
MKAQCYLCKAIKPQKEIELREVNQKGLLVYVCKYQHGEKKESIFEGRDEG